MNSLPAMLSKKNLLTLAFTLMGALAFGTPAMAAPRLVIAHATGQVVFVPCPDPADAANPTIRCQATQIAGQATVIGPLTGILFERVDLTTFSYSGNAVFTAVNDGSTITTQYIGQVIQMDPSGGVTFVESHRMVSGTGRFANATARLFVIGTADAVGHIVIDGIGVIDR